MVRTQSAAALQRMPDRRLSDASFFGVGSAHHYQSRAALCWSPLDAAVKGVGSGCGFTWTPISGEVLTERSWQGKSRRKRRRLGLPIE
jgi:hypothetical protein